MAFTLRDEYSDGTVGGACYICKASRRPGEKVVDPGIILDYEGLMQFCGTCIKEAASLLEMIPTEGYAEMKAENATLESLVALKESLLQEAQEATRAIAAVLVSQGHEGLAPLPPIFPVEANPGGVGPVVPEVVPEPVETIVGAVEPEPAAKKKESK